MIENKSHEVIVISDSTIVNFSFDEANHAISFDSAGESTFGFAEIYLDNILIEPFTVTIDGNADDNFTITEDLTTDQTSVGISYLHPVDKITISGIHESQNSMEKVPDWIKNNAKWWSEDLISEDDFIKGIHYMVENGIIVVN